jgi:hypothetical protein
VGTQAACWLKWGKTGTIFFLVSFLVGLIVCSVGILQESIRWTGFLTCIAIISQMGRFMWSLIQVFFIVPITIYTFFRGVYDFGPKHRKITLFDILLNPVPGIEFEGRLGESDDFDSRRRRQFNHNIVPRRIARNRRLNVKRTTKSIASAVHDCPTSHINSTAPKLYGYQSYFMLNYNLMGKIGTEGEHSMPMTLYFAICNFSCPDIFSRHYQKCHLRESSQRSSSEQSSRCSLDE